MKRFLVGCLVFVLFVGLAIPGGFVSNPTARAQTGQTYTVLVGAEQLGYKAEIMSYFPKSLQIHVGDTVTWQINSMEFHTVSFLAGVTMPAFVIPVTSPDDSPLMVNPLAVEQTPTDGSDYDGATYANSGIMGQDIGQKKTYSLKFTKAGTFGYVCIIHGTVMSGTINVVADTTVIPTPQQVNDQAQQEIAAEMAKIPHIVQLARSEIVEPIDNNDGTASFTVKIGYNSGSIDLMGFYPDHWSVRPGDKVTYEFSSTNLAPHTVTFLNGAADIPIAIPSTKVPGRLLLNPQVLVPSGGTTITNLGIFNSGFMDPANKQNTPQTYPIVIGAVNPGNLDYECLLHDAMGMTGTLTVVTDTTTTSDLLAMNALPTWFTSPGYILFMPTVASAAQQ